MRLAALACVALAACGGARRPVTAQPVPSRIATTNDRIVALLPDGAQVIIEIDLARLRANPVVGPLVTDALTGPPLPGIEVPLSPLAHAETLVLASYGIGTSNAATVTVLATTESVAGGVPLGAGLVALGPEIWTAQLEARAAIAGTDPQGKIRAAKELLDLRDHAMPPGAPGASVRLTARLSFDARVALARQTGLEAPPAQISIWGDVVDDLALVVDADAVDPGDRATKHPAKRLETGVRAILAGLAREPVIAALGLPSSLSGARIVAKGSWVRAIIAIGPSHLARVVKRAAAMLEARGKPTS